MAIGARRKKPAADVGGWARTDPDHTIRGWVTNRNDREARLEVVIRIDGKPAATLTADRLDPKLVALNEGDGRYAFAFMVPPRWRDDAPHRFEVVCRAHKFVLKSKADTFCIPPTHAAPIITASLEGGILIGAMDNWLIGKPPPLELRTFANERLPIETAWTQAEDQWRFEASLSDTAGACLLAGPARLTLPGMIEAGLPAPWITADLAISAEVSADGRVRVLLDGEPRLMRRPAIALFTPRKRGAQKAHQTPVMFEEGLALIDLPSTLGTTPLDLTVRFDGVPTPLWAPLLRRASLMTANPTFANWSEAIEGWTVSAPAAVSRGFFHFSLALRSEAQLTGDLAAFATEAGREQKILWQRHENLERADVAELLFCARSREPTQLRIRLARTNGEPFEDFIVELGLGAWLTWRWTVSIPDALDAFNLELWSRGEAAQVEVSRLSLGASEATQAAQAKAPAASSSAVMNGDFTDWPFGLVFQPNAGRTRVARGWFFVLSDGADALVRATAHSQRPTCTGLAAAATVKGSAKLLCQLHEPTLAALTQPLLRFEAKVAAELLGRDLCTIDRLVLLRRRTDRQGVREEVIGSAGRQILLSRELCVYEAPITLEGALNQSAASDPGSETATDEFFLSFEFRRDFAVQIFDVQIISRPAMTSTLSGTPSLEDPVIRAQAGALEGFEHWLEPYPLRPGPLLSEPRELTGKWRSPSPSATLAEVVVWAHADGSGLSDAVEACLATTDTPHLMTILVGSDQALERARLDDLCADRPWIRIEVVECLTEGLQRTIGQSSAPWVAILQADVRPAAGWLSGLSRAASEQPHSACVGPVTNRVSTLVRGRLADVSLPLPRGATASDLGFRLLQSADQQFPEAAFLRGDCLLLNRATFEALGGLERPAARTPLLALEDYCLRAKAAGCALTIADHVYAHSITPPGRRDESHGLAARVAALQAAHPALDVQRLILKHQDVPAVARAKALLQGSYVNLDGAA